MRLCIIGKFPPIEGGVSMQNYWSAHRLAARGHEIHVVTNAKEVRPPFRMHMRPEDWRRCEGSYGAGSVTVHWSDPPDAVQHYIPMASAFVSKLAGIAAGLHAEHPFDLIFSFYMEPYAVAGHLVAEMTGLPHVVRLAGSDAGRLWLHPQLEPLYDHVLRSAEILIGGGRVAQRAIARGVDPARIASLRGLAAPEDLFQPVGPPLDIAGLRAEIAADPDPEMRDLLWGGFAGDRPYIGLCGKLGEAKGSFPLLAAMQRLKQAGLDVGLVALAHGQVAVEKAFRARVQELGLHENVLQLPFLPHWRVPDFLRGCLAVCCLEQDFLVAFHTPTIPIEVLLNGTCLVGSTEVIRKLPNYQRLPARYGCVAIDDVRDVDALAGRLAAILRDPKPAAALGARGRRFARAVQRNWRFDQRLEHILTAAAHRKPPPPTQRESEAPVVPEEALPFTRLATAILSEAGRLSAPLPDEGIDGTALGLVAADLERMIAGGETRLAPLLPALRLERAIASAEQELAATQDDPLYRLDIVRWGMEDQDLAALAPIKSEALRLLSFDFDISPYREPRSLKELPPLPPAGESHLVVFARLKGAARDLLELEPIAARIMALSDGTHTAGEIADALAGVAGRTTILSGIEQLFVAGLLRLSQAKSPVEQPRPAVSQPIRG